MPLTQDIMHWRKAQRAELLDRRLAARQAERRQWNEAITNLLVECFPLLPWMVVGAYWPYKGEFDPRFAIRHLRARGARAALPVVVEKSAPLQFREWWPGAPMASGVFGLPVPEGTPVLRPHALLIPPVGFDSRGYRLGYGGGYFDRTLAAMEIQPLKIGVAFELSRMASIRPQPHDIAMDFIVTELGIHRVSDHGLELVADQTEALELAGGIVEERYGERDAQAWAARGDASFRPRYASAPCYAGETGPGQESG
jgi:5-formyltetrahydrofolate cyclo-ligase